MKTKQQGQWPKQPSQSYFCLNFLFLQEKNGGVEEQKDWFNDPAVLITPATETEQRIRKDLAFFFFKSNACMIKEPNLK